MIDARALAPTAPACLLGVLDVFGSDRRVSFSWLPLSRLALLVSCLFIKVKKKVQVQLPEAKTESEKGSPFVLTL